MKWTAVSTVILCGTCAYSQSMGKLDRIPRDAAGGTLQRGVAVTELPRHGLGLSGSASTNNLVDHGGPVLPASHIYYIWWGNQNAWPNDANTGLTDLAVALNDSPFLNDIFPQYMRGAGVSTAFVRSWYDTGAPPKHGPKTSTIVAEACRILTANGGTPDPSAIYMVLTSNFPNGVNYCGWHSYGTCNGATIQVAYLPNTTGVSGCNAPMFTCNQFSQGTNGIANILSHEFSEAITDADGSAWFDTSGNEIGDKCAWQFNACVDLTRKSGWQLQTEWSNAVSGCVQQ